MKCARHPYEGGAGVCAPCLRARLLALAAAQNEASSLPPLPLPPPPEPEPELVFPRSVSPYVCRRKSDASAAAARGRSPLLFFRTPQVGPAYGGGGGAGFVEGDIGFRRRRSGRFSVLAALFGHRSEEKEKENNGGGNDRRRRPSWLVAFGIGRRKKEQATASSPPPRRSWHGVSDQGLSPVRYACGDGDESGASPAAVSPWLPSPSPMRKTTCRRRSLGLGGPGAGGVSGFAVCISPLVRPGLLGSRHLRGGHPPDAVSSELRPSPLHPLTSSASLHHCRSWKLADGGRFRVEKHLCKLFH